MTESERKSRNAVQEAMDRRDFLHRFTRSAAAFGILHQVDGWRMIASPRRGPSLASIRDRYFLRFLELNPVVSTYLGGDGYDPSLAGINSKLRDYRPEALDAERDVYRRVRAELGQIDRRSLSTSDRIDHDP